MPTRVCQLCHFAPEGAGTVIAAVPHSPSLTNLSPLMVFAFVESRFAVPLSSVVWGLVCRFQRDSLVARLRADGFFGSSELKPDDPRWRVLARKRFKSALVHTTPLLPGISR